MSEANGLSPYLEAVGRDLDAAARREVARAGHRRPLGLAALIAAGLALVTGTALAASSVLGGPAPAAMQSALDAYFPNDGESLSPAPGHSVVVAQFGDDVLYRTLARDGRSTCTQVTARAPGGENEIVDAGCVLDTGDAHWPIGLQGHGFGGHLLLIGQARGPADASLHLVAGGTDARIPLGVDGFFLWELPLEPPGALGQPMPVIGSLELRAADGSELSQITVTGMPTPPPTAP
jgi:hypothetical protein